jgi:tetratricopeptide (TPR) repeat protein
MVHITMELLRANAGAHAASGDWLGLRELLADHDDVAARDAQLATLRAEAELRTGRPRQAHDWLGVVLHEIQRSGDRRSFRTGLNLRGVAELELGELDRAEQTFARVLELARNDGDELLTARAWNNLGALADMRDGFDDAIAAYEHAIPLYQRLGDPRGLAETHHNLAISHRHRGHLHEAEHHERQAIGYASETRNAILEALARLGLSELALERGDAQLAEAMARHATKRFVASNDPLREAEALRVLAAACLAQHKVSAAAEALQHACRLAVANGARLLEAEIRRLTAELLLEADDKEQARREANEAARLFEEVGSVPKAEEARRRAR